MLMYRNGQKVRYPGTFIPTLREASAKSLHYFSILSGMQFQR